MDNEGFAVNDFDHLDDAADPGRERKRIRSGWGFVREDLEKYNVHMLVDVRMVWDENTPPEMRQVFGSSSAVMHHLAETAIMNQLKHDGLEPTSSRDLFIGTEKDGTNIILRDSGWDAK